MRGVPTGAEAEDAARALLSSLADRWQHTRNVAVRAEQLAAAVRSQERELLVVAAWWHDLGYSPALWATGCHQIDGARYLSRERLPGTAVCARGAPLRGDD